MIFKKIRLSSSRASVNTAVSADSKLSLNTAEANQANTGLSPLQTMLATVFLSSWLFLFAGGIAMDSTQFRCAISSEGAQKLAAEARPGDDAAKTICEKSDAWVPVGSSRFSGETAKTYRLVVAWLGLVLFFLPLNLAVVSAAAGALGAIGNKANLENDPIDSNVQNADQSRDNSSPIMSGLLRGLFVYLFFISGLLLFDDKPFASPGPGQYVRLAGFISLISFLVNYRPHLFATISDWAFDRINSRKVVPASARKEEAKAEITVEERTEAGKHATNGQGKQGTVTENVKAALEQLR